jgi:diguanylate cyclase (GGDEF)-like protein
MDIRTLTLVNLILLFLYAAMMLVNSRISGAVRGGRWFAWSNLARGTAILLLMLGTVLPKFVSVVVGNELLVVGLMLLHRSVAEVLGRGRTAWNIHVALALAVFCGVTFFTFVPGGGTGALMLVSVALAVQMAVTTALLLSGLTVGMRTAAWFTGALVVTVLVGSLVGNGGTAFGFMFLSAAQLRLELTRQAERDALTGLLNRRGLRRLAESSLSKSHRATEPLSAVMLDLDGMKTANDTWGHECGDHMLCAVATLLVNAVGRRGAVARLGGDEFVIMLPGMALGGAVEVAERLRSAIERLHVPRCHPRASFGVASMTGEAWEEAVRQSDQALYRAKNAGKNQVACYG